MRHQACANNGTPGAVAFKGETFRISHQGLSAEAKGVSGWFQGWRCSSCGEIEFDRRSAKRYAAAGDKLVLQGARCNGRRSAGYARNSASAKLRLRTLRVAATMRSRVMSAENRRPYRQL